MSVLFLSGSPSRHPSRSAALLDYVSSRVRAASLRVESLAVRDIPADDLIQVRRDGVAAAALHALVERSRAIVIGTPVYNAAIPGGLKALLDLLPERALHGKTVLALASGGSAGHQLAIEYSLKPVLSALGARHVLAGVFACEGDVGWPLGPDAEPTLVPTLAARLDEAIDALLLSLSVRATPPPLRLAAHPGPLRAGAQAPPEQALAVDPERCSA